ncbi:MAG: histidinol-phosphate aminotransferase family protein [Cenarchaeum sp. SB0665_bin_23]|nr:histidinol-phosphate aminotransferase family protein [Acidimicrobiaceae bacterium]MXY37361.1 histidinol-phosphate aminotransferase family protein [Cenarchaeum sp. SB0664_bin_35]MXY60823.1 histidinol-phosphate aminotransferase family protein [Cenarchaeum sp. SB0665_bin_23]MYB47074.1 histidinol-phosphate aminotransferase family protein [Cenarchaeum sp. SB0662_bin_33]MYG33279.1 histidinol-phosphate aminotransferase family protein [Cenarchaeum sp. SB0677_bin_16]
MNTFTKRLDALSKLSSYERPPAHDGLRLDSNENLVIPKPIQEKITSRINSDIRLYPLDGPERLIHSISRLVGISTDQISVGNGSDQILDMVLSRLAGSKILVSDPTFSFFVDRCNLYDIRLERIRCRNDMSPDMDTIIRRAPSVDMIYLDSPNNPTGYQIPRADLRKLVESCDTPIMLDEAYADFGGFSAMDMVYNTSQLMVMRTLSKSFGLAGLRVGYMVASAPITKVFDRVIQYPYPLSVLSVDCAIQALQLYNDISTSWDIIKEERRRIIQTLRGFGAFDVFDSNANFVLFDAGGSYRRIHKALSEQGIHIRMLGQMGDATGCLRVTVGTHKMNSQFLLAVRDLLK